MPNRIVNFESFNSRKVRGTNIAKGKTLYAILNLKTGLYFIWAYANKEKAELIAPRVQPGNATDIAFNWRSRLDLLTPTMSKP